MPRSAETLQLNAIAHKRGDAYYRCLTTVARSEKGLDAECLGLAKAYLEALESLRSHLSVLPANEDVENLIVITSAHIRLVQKDLEHFQKSSAL